jgi:hypothetical protein
MFRQRIFTSTVAVLALQPVGWTATLINAERVHTGPHGSLPLCQAIPPTLLSLHVRYEDVRPGARVRLRVSVPGHRVRIRHLRLPARHGRVTRTFSPQGLRLRANAFEDGRYRVRGPGLRASLTLTGGARC